MSVRSRGLSRAAVSVDLLFDDVQNQMDRNKWWMRVRDWARGLKLQLTRATRRRAVLGERQFRAVMVNGPCDLSCAWCNIEGVRMTLPGDELEQVTTELEGLAERGTWEVCFGLHHAEPTTLPELPEMVSRARGLGFARLILSTSGMSIASLGYLERLVDAGLDEVILTMLTLDRARCDLLFGRPGATDRKLQALKNCMRLKLDISLPLMLLRPVLDGVAEAVQELGRLGEGYAGALSLHACLMDYVPNDRDRYGLLWPTYPEVQWTMNRVVRVAPSVRLLSKDMPLCVRKRIPGVDSSSYRVPTVGFVHPEAICGGCSERSACAGVPELYLERLPRHAGSLVAEGGGTKPPTSSVEALEASLRACGGGSQPTGKSGPHVWTAVMATALSRLGDADWLDGFRVIAVEEGPDRLAIRLRKAAEALHLLIEPKSKASRYYLEGERFVLSYAGDTPLDSAPKRAVAEAVLRVASECVGAD